jgi:predicted DCC family thiol-disulfide oxidoreductase YuxK
MDRIILYDGKCNLCCGTARFIKRHDNLKNFRFESLHSEEAGKLLQKSGLSGKDLKTLIYISSGQFYLRSSAVLHILKDMGGGWSLFYAFIIVPPVIGDFFYKIVATTRYRIFGIREECFFPAEEEGIY